MDYDRKRTGTGSRFTAIVLCILCAVWALVLLGITGPKTAYAAESEQKTVRVGYVNALNYEEGGEGEYKHGSGYEYLQQISYRTGWKYEYVYGSFKECYEKLARGEIDLFGNVSYTPERAEQISFSSYPQGKDIYLLYTTKDRPDLLQELNEALYEIQNTEKDYNSQLVNRYYNRMTSALLLNEKEKDWLAKRGSRLRVGYLADDLPFCGEENGQMIGVMQTVVQAIHESFGVEVETIPYDTLDEMSQAVRDGEVDMAGPMISDFYLAEQADQVLTIMDIMMLRRNGYEATRAIRSMENRPDGQTIPIIAMTANAFAEDIQASLDAGMNAHLSKPIVMEEVFRTIARNLNR